MLNKNSILFTITITFLVSIILVCISFTVLYKTNEKREQHFSHKRDIDVSKMVLRECRHNGISEELKQNLNEMNFSLITDERKLTSILQNKNIMVKKSFQRGMANIKDIKLNGKSYIYINTPKNKIMIKNNDQKKNHQYTLIAIFVLLLSMFILLYFITINKLKPLRTLKNNMKKFCK